MIHKELRQLTTARSSSFEIEALDSPGTIIEVKTLYPGVARHFENQLFINDLKMAIGEYFSTFLQNGLTVEVSRGAVSPVLVEVLTSLEEGAPAPYVYKKKVDGVMVSIVVGLNSGRRYEDDDEDIDFERDRSASTAGWKIGGQNTVLSNIREICVLTPALSGSFLNQLILCWYLRA